MSSSLEQLTRIADALERIAAYGNSLMQGMTRVLSARSIPHSFVGHPSMLGLYFDAKPPRNYRTWKSSDYAFYDAMAQVLHDEGVLCEPDSREPWFICEAHRELDLGWLEDVAMRAMLDACAMAAHGRL